MAYRKGLVLSLGMLNVTVKIDSAVQADESMSTVCVGTLTTSHAPTQISQIRTCPNCITTANPMGKVNYADLKKARKVGNDFQVVDQEEVADLKEAALGATKKLLTLAIHDAETVRANTLQSSGVYQLSPDGAGQAKVFSALYDGVLRHPEKAFEVIFTPTSRASLWQLKPFQGGLVMEQRVWPEQVVPAVPLEFIEPSAADRALFDQVLDLCETPFDVAAYRDTFAAELVTLLESKEAVAGEVTQRVKGVAAVPSGVVDLSAVLAAMVAEKSKKAAPKKRPVKKVAA